MNLAHHRAAATLAVRRPVLGRVTAGARSGESRPIVPAPGGDERMLLVEDEAAVSRLFTLLFESLGYQVTACPDGRAALSLFEADVAGFDLLLTDQVMPGLTGLELVDAVRARRPDLPVVLMTAWCEAVDDVAIARRAIQAFLVKPVGPVELAEAVRRALDGTPPPVAEA